MNKTLLYGVSIGVAGVTKFASLFKQESTKHLVERVWEEIKDEIINDLGLWKEPVLQYTHNNSCVMQTMHYQQLRGNMFEKVIVSTEASYIIEVNLKNVEEEINHYMPMALYSKKIAEAAIKHTFYHECRHIWQAQEGFHIGEVVRPFDNIKFNIREGYGESKEETDANKYAISMAKNKKEQVLFIYQKVNQDQANKTIRTIKEEKYAIHMQKQVIKTWNPIFKLFA